MKELSVTLILLSAREDITSVLLQMLEVSLQITNFMFSVEF